MKLRIKIAGLIMVIALIFWLAAINTIELEVVRYLAISFTLFFIGGLLAYV